MIYGLILLAAASIATAAVLPPCVCTRNYQPVCGSDGNTYDNQCMLDCAKASNNELSVSKTGKCPDAQNICVCTFEYKPVCGSDGQTYPNKCSLNCQRSVRLVGNGPCPQAASLKLETPPCVCTREATPVCGSDGVTYANPCRLNCATASNPKLSLKSYGACVDEVKVVDQPDQEPTNCACTRNMQPVCGSDGNTYANPCMLNCATAKNPALSIKSYGACADEVKVVDQPDQEPTTCACTKNMQPVCGSDGKTYANPCLLNCATAKNPALSIKSYGACADEVKVVDQPDQEPTTCACTRNMQPVCGSDGKTYANPCLLNCATAKNPALSITSYGACADEVKLVDQPDQEPTTCACTRNMQPVCGSDGKTYANPCLLNCATAKNPALSIKSHGACADEVKVVDQPDQEPTNCACTRNMQPICGSDGKTYANPCLLNCATAKNPALSIKSYGPCADEVKVAELKDISCACTRNMRPVCGSDGKTYHNPCLLNCATKNNPSLSVARQGPCEGVNVVDVPRPVGGCTCTRELAPVCASDGETYSSACIMRCRNPGAELVHNGPCEV